jgi:hypothetical protein
MTQEACEREPLVVAAARSGIWTADLREHAAACPACTETARVTALFLRQAMAVSAGTQPLPAHVAWQKLEARRQQLLIRRATRCMTLLCALAAIYAVALGAWYLPQLWRAPLVTNLSPLASGVALTGVLTAIFAVLVGSCCFVLLGSRTAFRQRS